MRYRLRTLLIVVTAVCMFFAWAAYVRRMERYHRAEENKRVAIIMASEHDLWPALAVPRNEHVQARVTALVEKGPRRNDRFEIRFQEILGSEDVTIYNGRGLSTRGRGDITDWREAIHHRIMADKYHHALIQPWVLLSGKDSP